MRLKNAIVKTFYSPGSFPLNPIRTITEPTIRRNRAHGRSECEEARSSALPFRANRRESAVLEVGPTQRPPLAPQRDSVALCWPEKKAEKKRTELGEVVVL